MTAHESRFCDNDIRLDAYRVVSGPLMGFFKRQLTPSGSGQPAVLSLSSGRRLRTDLALADCLATLEAVIRSYTQLESVHRSAYVVPGWQWNGASGSSPDTVISFNDTDGYPLFAAFWPSQRVTECALFPLGSGDDRLMQMPIIGYWKQQDPSLTSIGLVPQGQFAVAPPRVSDGFFDEIIRAVGYPSTPRNIEAIGTTVGSMLLVKAHEFISSRDPQAAERFVERHRYQGGSVTEFCQQVLNDLAAWNLAILPYIQDLPARCRSILLEPDGSTSDPFENLLTRSE